NEFGQTAGFGLGNGVQTNYTYDVKQRLVRINSTGDVDGTTKTLQDAVYAFNSRNNITGITNTSSEYTTAYNYSYDGLNRLIAADGQYQESADNYTKTFRQSFAYAKNGNLTAKRNHNFNDNTLIDEWNYQYFNHQVTNIDSTQSGNNRLVMNYDSSGNMTYQRDNFKDLTKTITIDSQNRIAQVQDALNTTIGNYSYDEGGFRVRKRALVPSGASFKNQEILYPSKFYGLEYSEETNVLSSINNVYLNGVRIAALNEDGVTAYFLTDQVDSVAHVLDEGAHTLSRMQYEPYGETLVQRGTLDFAPKYNSQELDRETNFYFYNARYYDPQIARFTSADSVIDGSEDTQGWNRFAYVKGNPTGAKDPTGNCIGGTWTYFAATCSGATKADPLDVEQRINYSRNSAFLKTAYVVNAAQPSNIPSFVIGQLPGIKQLSEKMNEDLYDNDPDRMAIGNFGMFIAGTYAGVTLPGVMAGSSAKAPTLNGGRKNSVSTPLVAEVSLDSLSKFNRISSSLEAFGVKARNALKGQKTTYENITKSKRHVTNLKTNITRAEFEKNLRNNGWRHELSKNGLADNYYKGTSKYSVRNISKSGPKTADYYDSAAGKDALLKIRFAED
ncbi:RHS repeat-associated core domain-containing protein, partial [Leptospira selangorensis]